MKTNHHGNKPTSSSFEKKSDPKASENSRAKEEKIAQRQIKSLNDYLYKHNFEAIEYLSDTLKKEQVDIYYPAAKKIINDSKNNPETLQKILGFDLSQELGKESWRRLLIMSEAIIDYKAFANLNSFLRKNKFEVAEYLASTLTIEQIADYYPIAKKIIRDRTGAIVALKNKLGMDSSDWKRLEEMAITIIKDYENIEGVKGK